MKIILEGKWIVLAEMKFLNQYNNNLLTFNYSALKPETQVKKAKTDAKILEKRAADKAARKVVCIHDSKGN